MSALSKTAPPTENQIDADNLLANQPHCPPQSTNKGKLTAARTGITAASWRYLNVQFPTVETWQLWPSVMAPVSTTNQIVRKGDLTVELMRISTRERKPVLIENVPHLWWEHFMLCGVMREKHPQKT